MFGGGGVVVVVQSPTEIATIVGGLMEAVRCMPNLAVFSFSDETFPGVSECGAACLIAPIFRLSDATDQAKKRLAHTHAFPPKVLDTNMCTQLKRRIAFIESAVPCMPHVITGLVLEYTGVAGVPVRPAIMKRAIREFVQEIKMFDTNDVLDRNGGGTPKRRRTDH